MKRNCQIILISAITQLNLWEIRGEIIQSNRSEMKPTQNILCINSNTRKSKVVNMKEKYINKEIV